MTVWIGIDPGLDGAMVVLHSRELQWFDTPTFQDGTRRRIDAAKCASLLRTVRLANDSRIMATIEKSQPMPPHVPGRSDGPVHGSIASFSLGYSFGLWIGALAALQIPYQVVTPQSWKKALMPGAPKEKDASRMVARRLWPSQTEEALSRKKDHGRADAALLAEYGRRISGVLDE